LTPNFPFGSFLFSVLALNFLSFLWILLVSLLWFDFDFLFCRCFVLFSNCINCSKESCAYCIFLNCFIWGYCSSFIQRNIWILRQFWLYTRVLRSIFAKFRKLRI
jgi:hypothetical protein